MQNESCYCPSFWNMSNVCQRLKQHRKVWWMSNGEGLTDMAQSQPVSQTKHNYRCVWVSHHTSPHLARRKSWMVMQNLARDMEHMCTISREGPWYEVPAASMFELNVLTQEMRLTIQFVHYITITIISVWLTKLCSHNHKINLLLLTFKTTHFNQVLREQNIHSQYLDTVSVDILHMNEQWSSD